MDDSPIDGLDGLVTVSGGLDGHTVWLGEEAYAVGLTRPGAVFCRYRLQIWAYEANAMLRACLAMAPSRRTA